MSAVRAIGPALNLNIVQTNPSSRSGPASSLSFRHNFLHFEAAFQTRLTLPGLFGFSTGWCGKYHSFPKVPFTSDSSNIFTKSFSTSVSNDCWYKIFRFGPVGIFAPVSKTGPGLSCSCLVGLALVHSTAFPLRTARLWTSSYSIASSLPTVPSLTDWQRWFRKHRFLCSTRFGYSQPLSHLQWRRNFWSSFARHRSSDYPS